MIIRNAEVAGCSVDVRIDGDRIAEIAPRLPRSPDDLDAAGCALLPGLVDHHIHLHATAAAAGSVQCGPPTVTTADELAAALNSAAADATGWVRGVGYAEQVAGDLDAAVLDRLHPERPVRIQHRSGALWIVNSAGAAALGLVDVDHPGIERDHDGSPTGRLWRADNLVRRLIVPTGPPDLTGLAAQLTAYGISAVTDATPDLDATAVAAIAALPLPVTMLGAPLDGGATGPYKIVLADSDVPDLDRLTARIAAAHGVGRPVAVHCVTRESLALLLAAFDDAGVQPGDRIEHAALVPAELAPELARRGLRVVTQPGFLADRGDDYLRDVAALDQPDLYRCRSLQDAGVALALSSDAPYGPLDPWAVMAAAVQRRTRAGAVVGRAERLDPAAALAAYLAPPDDPGGRPRQVVVGARADLVLLDRPLAALYESLRGSEQASPVRVTLLPSSIPGSIRMSG